MDLLNFVRSAFRTVFSLPSGKKLPDRSQPANHIRAESGLRVNFLTTQGEICVLSGHLHQWGYEVRRIS